MSMGGFFDSERVSELWGKTTLALQWQAEALLFWTVQDKMAQKN